MVRFSFFSLCSLLSFVIGLETKADIKEHAGAYQCGKYYQVTLTEDRRLMVKQFFGVSNAPLEVAVETDELVNVVHDHRQSLLSYRSKNFSFRFFSNRVSLLKWSKGTVVNKEFVPERYWFKSNCTRTDF